MSQEHFDAIKKQALSIGERTNTVILMELKHDGQVVWNYAGKLENLLILKQILERQINKMYDDLEQGNHK